MPDTYRQEFPCCATPSATNFEVLADALALFQRIELDGVHTGGARCSPARAARPRATDYSLFRLAGVLIRLPTASTRALPQVCGVGETLRRLSVHVVAESKLVAWRPTARALRCLQTETSRFDVRLFQ